MLPQIGRHSKSDSFQFWTASNLDRDLILVAYPENVYIVIENDG
jgi:hypothetical protein